MEISTVNYLGDLRTECIHYSGEKILTDAPKDNFGKGEAFSPTDLMATSLAACFITIMGIYCQQNGINMEHCTAKVEKIMSALPRKIAKINIRFNLSENHWDKATFDSVVSAGKKCPVGLTIEEVVAIDYIFE